jgi:hypothetical protein
MNYPLRDTSLLRDVVGVAVILGLNVEGFHGWADLARTERPQIQVTSHNVHAKVLNYSQDVEFTIMTAPFQNLMRWRLLRLCVTCVLIAVSTTASVRAANEGPSDIFSTPDTLAPPTFSGRNKPAEFVDPLFGPGGDPPGRDAIRAIPTMTGKQLATVDQLIFSNRDAITPMQEELNSLRRILDQRKNKKYPPVIQMSRLRRRAR